MIHVYQGKELSSFKSKSNTDGAREGIMYMCGEVIHTVGCHISTVRYDIWIGIGVNT